MGWFSSILLNIKITPRSVQWEGFASICHGNCVIITLYSRKFIMQKSWNCINTADVAIVCKRKETIFYNRPANTAFNRISCRILDKVWRWKAPAWIRMRATSAAKCGNFEICIYVLKLNTGSMLLCFEKYFCGRSKFFVKTND